LDRTIIWGHRGAGFRGIENSMSSFKKAVEMGVDGLKTEANLTNDGHIVLVFPYNFKIDGERRKIRDLNLDQINEVKLSNGESIPTLTELFEMFKDSNLKYSFDIFDINTGKRIVELAKRYNVLENIEIAKPAGIRVPFDEFLYPLRKLNENVILVNSCFNSKQISENGYTNLKKMIDLDIQVVNLNHHNFSYKIFELVKEKGLKSYLWGVLFKYFMRKYLKIRVDAIYTNFPDKILELRKEIQGI